MPSRRVRASSFLFAALLLALAGGGSAQEGGAKQVTGAAPGKSDIKLFTDPGLKPEHTSKSIASATVKWPRPVLEEAPNGALRVMLDTPEGRTAVWLHPSEVRTGKVANAECLLAQRSTGPIGATRGANEGCAGSK